jgi:hypothetical protein
MHHILVLGIISIWKAASKEYKDNLKFFLIIYKDALITLSGGRSGRGASNQRPPAERGPGPFKGPASYPQLCWWSLIFNPIKKPELTWIYPLTHY